MTVTVSRRTFEAAKYPKGSEERARLNCDALTSEYYTSMRYMTSDGRTFRIRSEALAHADAMNKPCDDCGAAAGEECSWPCSSNYA